MRSIWTGEDAVLWEWDICGKSALPLPSGYLRYAYEAAIQGTDVITLVEINHLGFEEESASGNFLLQTFPISFVQLQGLDGVQ